MNRSIVSTIIGTAFLIASGTARAQSSDTSSGDSAATSPAPSTGGTTDPARLEEARSLYRDGVTAFHARHFGDAVIAFERSFAVRPHPTTLYNAAEARFRGGDHDRAIEQLRQMLAMTSPAPDAATVERARALAHEGGVDDLQPAPSQSGPTCPACPTCAPTHECPTCPTVAPSSAGAPTVLEIALAGAGFVLFGAGWGFYGVALGDAGAYISPDNMNNAAFNNALVSQGETFRAVGLVGIILGIAAEAGAVVLYRRQPAATDHTSHARTSPSIAHFDAGPGGFMLTGTF